MLFVRFKTTGENRNFSNRSILCWSHHHAQVASGVCALVRLSFPAHTHSLILIPYYQKPNHRTCMIIVHLGDVRVFLFAKGGSFINSVTRYINSVTRYMAFFRLFLPGPHSLRRNAKRPKFSVYFGVCDATKSINIYLPSSCV